MTLLVIAEVYRPPYKWPQLKTGWRYFIPKSMELWWPRTSRTDELLVSGKVQFSPPKSVTVTKNKVAKKKESTNNKHGDIHPYSIYSWMGELPLRYHTHPRPPGDVAPWVTWRPPWPPVRRHPPQRRGGMLGELRGVSKRVSKMGIHPTWWLMGFPT